MNNLIEKVLQWGIDKNITGPNGKGNTVSQANKMLEEANETSNAVRDYTLPTPSLFEREEILQEIKDGIGDTCVTLILLAEMYGFTLEECLDHAYQIIAKRTGKMENGTFVKDQ